MLFVNESSLPEHSVSKVRTAMIEKSQGGFIHWKSATYENAPAESLDPALYGIWIDIRPDQHRGIELLKKIRELNSRRSLIYILSCNTSTTTLKQEALEAGAMGLIEETSWDETIPELWKKIENSRR